MNEHAPATPSRSTPALSPALRILLGLAAAAIVLAALSFARGIVGPLALGAVIVIICHPLRHPLMRRGWPRWAATTAVILLAYLILAVLAALLLYAGMAFAQLVTDFYSDLQGTAADTLAWLQSVGLSEQAADAAASVLEPGNVLSFAASLGGTVVGVLLAFFFVLAYVIFMAADASRYTGAEAVFGASVRPALRRFRTFNRGVRRYFVVNATFGAIVGVIDGFALLLLDIPAPAVWAILAFVTNFVPNIGFVLGLIPPVVLAVVVGGWPLALVVVAIYCVVNVTLQMLVQPKFISDAVNLSLTLSFFAVIFWTFIIGPLGAILSIPLTLLVRALLLEGDPDTRWLRWLSGDTDVALERPRAQPNAST